MNQKKTIGILHYQIGNTDGVSLEIDKWGNVFTMMGYQVTLCAGDLGARDGIKILELYHHHPEILEIDQNGFDRLNDFDPGALLNTIEILSRHLEEEFEEFIKNKQVDLLVVNNIWSVGLNLPAGIALARVCKKRSMPAIGHHHDFYWERRGGSIPTCQPIEHILKDYFPPDYPSLQHVVINSLAKKALAERKGLQSLVIPNVFDFDAPAWSLDAYNQDLRRRIGLKESDIMVLQATRVIPRKAIELAIDFLRTLNAPERRSKLIQSGLHHGKPFTKGSRIVLVMTGYTKDDVSGNYMRLLVDKARQENVELLHVEDKIAYSRHMKNGEKVYSFWDAYVAADLVTYPSLWEGWGNQLLEAVQARLPVVLFEHPVYGEDIKDKGFNFITLGSQISGHDQNGLVSVDQEILDRAADDAVVVLMDSKRRQQMVSHNHEIAQTHYSLQTLETILTNLLMGF
jgi:mannosylglucosylglycerate synthase